jgi:membrane-associated phospholipid phosphatase
MYRFFEFLGLQNTYKKRAEEIPWHHPYGLLEKIWLVVWGLLGLLGLVMGSQIVRHTELLTVSVAMLTMVLVVPQITTRLGQAAYEAGRIAISIISAWYTYESAAQLIASFRSVSYEAEMILADRMLFGGNPSEWTEVLINPVLTEYLQMVYVSYFPMMLLVALALLATREKRTLFTYLIAMNLAVMSCHLFYFLVPVRSPFLIAGDEAFASLIAYSAPLQGLWWTEALRQNLLNATTMRYDCFPSGHTMHSLLAIYFAWKIHPALRTLVFIVGGSIIFSTIYLRYHYAIDLIVGAGFAVFWVWASHKLAERTYASEPAPVGQLSHKILSVVQQWSGDRRE